MRWSTLTRQQGHKEKDLEELLRTWLTGQVSGSDIFVAGIPDWFPVRPLHKKQGLEAVGYRYFPDGISDHEGRRFVFEFKFAEKGEPIALAEVLHHSYFQRHKENLPTVPVVLGQFNEWTRAAIAHLIEDGLRLDHIRYIEADLVGPRGGKRKLLWLDEPLAPWRPDKGTAIPDEVKQKVGALNIREWFFVESTKTWWAQDGAVTTTALLVPKGGGRPLFYEGGRWVAIARARSIASEQTGTERWIASEGRASPGRGLSISWDESFWFGE